MSNTLKHTTIPVAPTKITRDDWGEEHTFAGGALNSLLYRDTGASDGAGWTDAPTLASLTLTAVAAGGTSGVYAGARALVRFFKPTLAAGGQADGENVFVGGGNSTMSNGASGTLGLASYNTGMGWDTLIAVTTGTQNTAFGHRAGKAITTGQYNVAIGGGALLNNATNIGNVGVGTSALLTLTASGGDYNTGVGHDALEFLQTGTMNTAIGKRSNWQMTAGDDNTSVGGDTLYANLTGSLNVAIGSNALAANLASNNTAVGAFGLVANTTGTENAVLGRAALLNTTASSFNTAVGNLAGRYQADGVTALTAAASSVYIGYQARGFNNSDSNTIAIGANAAGAGANTAVIGNSAVSDVYFGSSSAAATAHAALFQTHTALVALGGGSAPTLGTIGGSGPATAGQNSWLRMIDSTGAAFWVPAWK